MIQRGNKMIFSFDYIKTTSEKNSNNLSHWQLVGDMVTKFKNFIAHEPIHHKTSIGRNPSKCKMNKSKRRSFKKYNGQGK